MSTIFMTFSVTDENVNAKLAAMMLLWVVENRMFDILTTAFPKAI